MKGATCLRKEHFFICKIHKNTTYLRGAECLKCVNADKRKIADARAAQEAEAKAQGKESKKRGKQ